MRRLVTFACAGETLVGTIDEAPGSTGLLIVSGGNEVRIGAHRGMAELAQRLAGAGHPVFRFDRRGVGDSTGGNLGFRQSAPDIAGAAATFCAEVPQVRRLVAFGNCDAATALALFHGVASLNALVLANPWVAEQPSDLPPAAAIRARYAARLRDPGQWLRALTGGVNFVKLSKGLKKLSETGSSIELPLAMELAGALTDSAIPLTILLARGDNTAIAFRQAWAAPAFAPVAARARLIECDTAGHSFAHAADKQWLYRQLLAALES